MAFFSQNRCFQVIKATLRPPTVVHRAVYALIDYVSNPSNRGALLPTRGKPASGPTAMRLAMSCICTP